MDYNFTYKETLEYEKHGVFPSDMSKWTMVALAHRENVIKALEKQVPRSPIFEGDGYSDGEMVYDRWYCPRCNMDYDAEYEKHDYCPICGQSIDWSSNNE